MGWCSSWGPVPSASAASPAIRLADPRVPTRPSPSSLSGSSRACSVSRSPPGRRRRARTAPYDLAPAHAFANRWLGPVDRIGRASGTRDADVFRWMNAALSELGVLGIGVVSRSPIDRAKVARNSQQNSQCGDPLNRSGGGVRFRSCTVLLEDGGIRLCRAPENPHQTLGGERTCYRFQDGVEESRDIRRDETTRLRTPRREACRGTMGKLPWLTP